MTTGTNFLDKVSKNMAMYQQAQKEKKQRQEIADRFKNAGMKGDNASTFAEAIMNDTS